VLVMSSRPGRIVAEHRIPLSRPRHMEDPGVIPLASRVLADLQVNEEGRR
jgi:ABC-type nitrate/sulfonate/bicarbonate transport system ATPase subunit